MYYAVEVKNRTIGSDRIVYITEGETSTDALLTAYEKYAGHERFDEAYDEAGYNGNALAEQLTEVFDCTEISRAVVLEYVERRLDGDRSIQILL